MADIRIGNGKGGAMKNWAMYILVALGVVTYNAVSTADRDESGAIVSEGSVDAFQVKVGDCFDDANAMDAISSLPGVPCEEPHDNEAYAIFDVSLPEYPDIDAMGELAYDSCMEKFEGFVGKDYATSTLEIFTLYPSAQSWAQNDREVVCAVYNMNAEKLVGSVKGRGI